MSKKTTLLILIILGVAIFNMFGCSSKNMNQGDVIKKSFDEILEDSRDTTVTFYGWGGSEKINTWIDGYLSEKLKKEYGITVQRVGMNIDEILNKLLNEKQLDVKNGNIDIVWINGENFFTAKENDLLFGPFTEKLPNFNKYIDKNSYDVKYDFGYPIRGYEAPYGKAQFIMIYDSEAISSLPKGHEELFEFAKANPGAFTYPAPPDFTGSAFVRNIICDIVGYEQFVNMEADEETVRKAVYPAIDYLKKLKPYLWQEGKTYPAEISLLDNMYADGEVLMTMSYEPNHASGKILTGEFKESTRSFIFEKGTIGNTHFLAIPFNAPNKAGALALINYILKVETQSSKYVPEIWGDLPVVDNHKLSEEEKHILSSVELGVATLPQYVLAEKRIPEIPVRLIPIIEKIWMETIPVEGD